MKHLKKSKTSKKSTFQLKGEIFCFESDLLNIANDIVAQVQCNDLICLNGELGAGKSTFARALLNAMGLTEHHKPSPSFPIAIEYALFFKDFLKAIHIDFYRIKNVDELEFAGINELIWNEKNICIVEWAEKFPECIEQILSSKRRVWWFEIYLGQNPLERRLKWSCLKA